MVMSFVDDAVAGIATDVIDVVRAIRSLPLCKYFATTGYDDSGITKGR